MLQRQKSESSFFIFSQSENSLFIFSQSDAKPKSGLRHVSRAYHRLDALASDFVIGSSNN